MPRAAARRPRRQPNRAEPAPGEYREDRFDRDDPHGADLTPADRLHEVARLLAIGIRRLLTPAGSSPASPEHIRPAPSPESEAVCLELPAGPPLLVRPG
jgi:hypothetical protein